jgi:predicted lipid-binding transport protein (Tim44 family)
MSDCKVIQVIVTTLTRRGKGVEGDPIHTVTQYWTLEGELLFEKPNK